MGALRVCFIVCFPLFFTLAALVLTIFVIIGNLENNAVLSKLYFMRLNTQHLSVTVDGNNFAATSVDPSFPGFFQVGLWNYCEGTVSDNVYAVTNCTATHGLFYFNPLSVIEDRLGVGTIANVPSQVTSALQAAKAISYVMIILYCISAIVTAVEFITGLFCFSSGICTVLASLPPLACLVVATALSTALYFVEAQAFNDANNVLGTTASTNTITFGIAWAAVAAAVLATIFWCFSFCCAPIRDRRKSQVVYHPVDSPLPMHQL
ncbi:actin cortical patch SUR7/pH-response regulator pali [Lipomyces kononenkoae]|uniref:Actin cortical patch SUR7/pH-response regulator pali n=1 Tax=Lipomyces kononenkoae TaxID=34357 RepID=A0ACC3T666_LIPKO